MTETVLIKKKKKKQPEDRVILLIEDKEDKKIYEVIKKLIPKILSKTYLGMTEYQIKNFVLNKKEFPTEWSRLQQAKLELYIRFKNLILLYFDWLEAKAKMKLYEEQIKELSDSPVDQAKKELLKVKVMREQFKMNEIKKVANDKVKECKAFLDTYLKYKHLDDLPVEEQEKLIEETWKKKVMMMPEIFEDRYGEEYLRTVLSKEEYEEYQKMKKLYMA